MTRNCLQRRHIIHPSENFKCPDESWQKERPNNFLGTAGNISHLLPQHYFYVVELKKQQFWQEKNINFLYKYCMFQKINTVQGDSSFIAWAINPIKKFIKITKLKRYIPFI